MKHLILFFSTLLICTSLMAQRAFVEDPLFAVPASNQKILGPVDTIKTLGYAAYMRAPQALYKDQFGGFAVGTNFFGDLAKAQEYTVNSQKNISKVLFFFASKRKVAPDSTSYLLVNIYKLDGTGTATSATKDCPGTIIHSRKLLLDSIDTIAGHLTTVNFEWAPTFDSTSSFAVGFDMSHLDTADRVGLYSTKDSTALQSQRSWEKQSNGNWYTFLKSWPLDINLAIFPVVDTAIVGISNLEPAELGLQLSPNPANESCELRYSTAITGLLQLKIYNNFGQVVWEEELYSNGKKNQKISLATHFLKSGMYTCSLMNVSHQQRIKLLVQH